MQSAVVSDLVYFLHIPKTSGTSLHHSMLEAFGPEAASPPLLWDDLVNGTYQLSERTRVITGHFGGFLPLWLKRRPRIVTILREPLSRALSHINHVQRDQRHPLHPLAARLTVDQYCEHPVLRRTVDNFQSRYLASLDFALTMMPRLPERPVREPRGSISVGFENALFSLDKQTGLRDAAVRALSAIDAVGICEAHTRVAAGPLQGPGLGSRVSRVGAQSCQRPEDPGGPVEGRVGCPGESQSDRHASLRPCNREILPSLQSERH